MKKGIFYIIVLIVFAIMFSGCKSTNGKPVEEDDGPKYYTVTFDCKGYAEIPTIQVLEGEKITKPDVNIKGFSVLDWRFNKQKWDFDNYEVHMDIDLVASVKVNTYYLRVTYNNNQNDLYVRLNYGATLPHIDTPTYNGYTFLGWSEEIPDKMPDHNLWIIASWEINKYTITVKYEDGVTPDLIITEDYHTYIGPLDAPTREGYTFMGWSVFVPYNMPAENIVTKAQWKINKYRIYAVNATYLFEYNEEIRGIQPRKYEGYTFIGWNPELPERMPAHDMNIRELYQVNQYTITIKYNDGVTEDLIITQDYNTFLPTLENPTREGYTFKQWSTEYPKYMPAYDITINAIWE